jgi:hypothetical protein
MCRVDEWLGVARWRRPLAMVRQSTHAIGLATSKVRPVLDGWAKLMMGFRTDLGVPTGKETDTVVGK